MLELLRILFKRFKGRALYHVVYEYETKSKHMKISGRGAYHLKHTLKLKVLMI